MHLPGNTDHSPTLPRTTPRTRPLSPWREHLRDTFWFAPALGLLGAVLLAALVAELDSLLVSTLRDHGDLAAVRQLISVAEDSKAIVTTVGSAMLTFIGVVFSISLVALQMASGQFSPRVVRLYVRSRITKGAFSVFLATFLFALLVQSSYESETDPAKVGTVPFLSSITAVLLVFVSLVLFVAYVNSTIRMMRVSHVVDRITHEAFHALRVPPWARHAPAPPPPTAPGETSDTERPTAGPLSPGDPRPPGDPLPPAVGEIVHRGRAGVLRDLHVARLTRVARRHGTVLRLVPRIGDFVVPGTPLMTAHGGTVPTPRALRRTVFTGVERTFHQDLGFGLRQLADIALRALSPAVNDPTTAVQCLDRITQFLAAVAALPLGALHHCDRGGTVRLVQDLPSWEDLVDLGIAEIRGVATASPQVTRRLAATLDDLARLVPPERRPVLERHRALLTLAVERTASSPADRDFALVPDRQGIG